MDWTAEELWFDSWQQQEIFLVLNVQTGAGTKPNLLSMRNQCLFYRR